MRIIEQSRDRLVIEDRKPVPMWQPALVVLVLTLPLLIAYVNGISQRGSWRVLAIVIFIWTITAAIYAAVIRRSARPRMELDAESGRAKIGTNELPLSAISSVITTPVSDTVGLTITLSAAYPGFSGRAGHEIQIFSANTATPAERSRTAKIINAFLDSHRHSTQDNTPDVERAGEDGSPPWARAWDAESTANRKCFYCGAPRGDTGPLQLWAEHGRLQIELIFIPRCRRCHFIHGLNKHFLPPFAVLAGLIAGVALFMTRIADELHSDLARIGAFFVVAIGTMAAAFLLARLVTAPRLFGSTDRDAWKQIPELQRALQNGWKLSVRRYQW